MNKTMKITLDGIDISKLFYSVTNIKRNIGSNWVNTTSPRLQGAEFLYNALGSKTISFDYIIDGVFFEEINAKKELLAKYLNVKEPVPLIFNDEPNKVWYVVPDGEQSFEQATGTITFLVPKGYAESVYTKVLNNDNSGGENGTIINNADHSVSVLINNNGTLPIYPTIKVTPTSETGYLAFVRQMESSKLVIQMKLIQPRLKVRSWFVILKLSLILKLTLFQIQAGQLHGQQILMVCH